MPDPNAHVAMGTVHDLHTAAPRTVQRDYDTALIPSMRVDLTELRRLRGVLDDVEAGILAYKAEVAAEAAADPEGAYASAKNHEHDEEGTDR